ncbi:unnamed protein product [Durusdinium trenchii]|uniref:Cysteine dioxygenase n=1 Tax=Durusdinium trenchii TaxID=1381693 RepID=A0ABP0M811_9DINO
MLGSIPPVQEESVKRKGNKKDMEEISDVVMRYKRKVLQQTRLNPREWQQHAVFRRGRYTRNIVGYSPNQFIALLLCWEKGQQSPIHDHSGAHCFIKMLSGRIRERKFAWAADGTVGPEAVTRLARFH